MRRIYMSFVCFILALSAVFTFATEKVYASESESQDTEIGSTRSSNVQSIDAHLGISKSGQASVTVIVKGVFGVSKIDMTVKLQKYNSKTEKWAAVKTWTKTVNGSNASLNKTYTLSSKGKYRCKVLAEVTGNGKTESVTETSSSVVY